MKPNQLYIGGLSEIQSWGWSNEMLAHEINRFRNRSIRGLNEQCFVEPVFFGQLLSENETTWKIIFDQPKNILGFWQYVPLVSRAYDLSEQGLICGNRIVREIVPRMEPGNWYDAYFFSLSICSTIRKSLVAVQFAGSIIQSLVDLAKKDIFINRMSMCFASPYSMLMNRFLLQFEYCSEHIACGKVHRTRIPDFLESRVMQISAGSNVKELLHLYELAQKSPPHLA